MFKRNKRGCMDIKLIAEKQRQREQDKKLEEIQRKRDEEIQKARKDGTLKCLHKLCPTCKGTGRKPNGLWCIHGIACPCTKCSPIYNGQ